MKKIISCVLVIVLVLSMTFILTGCGEKQQPSDTNSNLEPAQQVNSEGYEKIIKVELVQENGEPYNGYEFYTYYYFKDDKLIAQDNVYIFGTENQAQTWYDQHVAGLEDKTISTLNGNMVIDKDMDLVYKDRSYSDILNIIKQEPRNVGYTEE